jgi:lysophospholipase L1-like esterase
MSDYTYSGVTPFRGWCEKVLPTVYDDSLSYSELLGKVIEKLNDVIHDDDITRARVDELQNYLDYLDVYGEIDKKLDEMAASGELDPIIDRVINVQKYDSLAAVVATHTQDITALSATKRNVDAVGYVNMDALAQDVKTALVGGGQNIPVVGAGAVDTVNLQNGAVTHTKMKKSILPVSLWGGQLTINRTLHTLIMPRGFVFTGGGTTVICYNDIAVVYDPTVRNAFITFNNATVDNQTVSSITITSNRDIDQYVIGRLNLGEFYFASDVDIIYTDTVNTDSRAGHMSNARIDKIVVDFAEGKIKFNRSNNLLLNIGSQYVSINTTQTGVDTYQDDITMPDFTAGAVVLNTLTKKIEIKNALASLAENYVALGFYNKSYNTASFAILYDIITDDGAGMLHKIRPEIAIIGDSVTAGVNTTHTYMEIANQICGIRMLNYGIGSTGWAFDLESGTSHLTGNKNFAVGTSQTVPTQNRFESRAVSAITNDGAKAIIYFGGTNDYGKNIPITTFETAVRSAINTLLTQPGYTGIRSIGVITPLRRVNGETPNAAGHKLSDYVNVLKTVCAEVGIPCLDLYNRFPDPGKYTWLNVYYTGDMTTGLHPNLAGHEKMALMIQDFVIQNFSYLTK